MNAHAPTGFDISDMGERGLVLTSTGPLDLRVQEKIWQLSKAPELWLGVTLKVAGVNNLLVLFDPEETSFEALSERVSETWSDPPEIELTPKEHVVPVRYGGAQGYDLEEVAAAAGVSVEQYIRRHTDGAYVVMTVGAYPGFGFLGGLDPALAVPRRAAPRARVEAGAVMIGGAQTAVMTTTSPSGWNVIGQTDARLLDMTRDRPSALFPGDRVRFACEAVS